MQQANICGGSSFSLKSGFAQVIEIPITRDQVDLDDFDILLSKSSEAYHLCKSITRSLAILGRLLKFVVRSNSSIRSVEVFSSNESTTTHDVSFIILISSQNLNY